MEIVVNDVLRTLWVGATMQNQLREAQALMTIPQRATHAPCKTWMGINVFGDIESTFSGASVSFVLSHIARYVPSPEENSCIPITHFQCKNNFEHLLNDRQSH